MRRQQVYLWITEDPLREIALVTGRGDLRTVLRDADLEDDARWSTFGRGWAIPADRVADLLAFCEHEGVHCRTRPRPDQQP